MRLDPAGMSRSTIFSAQNQPPAVQVLADGVDNVLTQIVVGDIGTKQTLGPALEVSECRVGHGAFSQTVLAPTPGRSSAASASEPGR